MLHICVRRFDVKYTVAKFLTGRKPTSRVRSKIDSIQVHEKEGLPEMEWRGSFLKTKYRTTVGGNQFFCAQKFLQRSYFKRLQAIVDHVKDWTWVPQAVNGVLYSRTQLADTEGTPMHAQFDL